MPEANEPHFLLTDGVKASLQKTLAKFMGPMAEIVCLDHFEGGRIDLQVIEALTKEIPRRGYSGD